MRCLAPPAWWGRDTTPRTFVVPTHTIVTLGKLGRTLPCWHVGWFYRCGCATYLPPLPTYTLGPVYLYLPLHAPAPCQVCWPHSYRRLPTAPAGYSHRTGLDVPAHTPTTCDGSLNGMVLNFVRLSTTVVDGFCEHWFGGHREGGVFGEF